MPTLSRRHFLPVLASVAGAPLCGAAADGSVRPNWPESKHGLHFDTPSKVWDEALPLGNGTLGALVWGDGAPLKISLDRVDLWDLRDVPEFHSSEYSFQRMKEWHEQGKVDDLLRVYEKPYNRPAPTKIPAGRIEIALSESARFEATSLDLLTALAEMKLAGVTAQAFVHATQPVGLIRVKSDEAPKLQLVAPKFAGKVEEAAAGGIGAGDLRQLGYPAPVETSGENWRAYEQTGDGGFHYAVYAAWGKKDGAWQAAWSVASSFEGESPLAIAKRRVDAALTEGFDAVFATHKQWWRKYWSQSSVRLPNAIIERQWYLEQYKFGSASRRGAAPITLQAVWTADDGKLPPWKGDYHHDLNTELSYWPCYSANHLEEGLAYLDWLWKTRDTGYDWTKRFFGLPGLNIPMTADLKGRQIGGWRQYTHSATTSAWLSQHFYWHWKYSGDRQFLRERAYPYLRDTCIFLDAFTAKKGPDGKRTHPLSASPEINDNLPSAWFSSVTNYDLALERWAFGAAAELARELGQTKDAARWKNVLTELPEFSTGGDGRLLVAKDYPLPQSHRHFSHLMAIHPLGVIDWSDGEEARRTIQASLAELDRLGTGQWCGYSFSWLASMAARAHDGEKAARSLEIFSTAFTLRNSFHCNGDQSGKGYSQFRYRPFTLEGNFAAAAGVQEMLLQSHRGTIVVFPAVPAAWQDAAFTTLRAQGAFLVSAQRAGGVVTRVEIASERGGVCKLLSPFSGKPLRFEMKPGERKVLTQDPPSAAGPR